MELSELSLDRFLYRQSQQNLETKDAVYDASNVVPAIVPPVAAGGSAQDINTSNVTINGDTITPGTFPPGLLDVSNFGWGQTSAFSSTDLDTVSWGAGVFTSANGDAYSIGAGNTGNMVAKTYIYLDLNVSSTAYQITTVSANAVGIGKVLIAVAQNAAVSATYNLSEATQIVGDNILANTISASKITAGQLIVGTNVGLGTAQDSAGVTTIIGNVVTTGFINALGITVLGAVVSGSFAIGSNAWHVDSSGNMWWGNYSTYALALAGIAPVFSSAGVFNFLQIKNSTNISSYGLNIELTHGSNTAAGVQIIQSGAGFGMLQTISGSSKGVYIINNGSGQSIEIVANIGDFSTPAIDVTHNAGTGNPVGIKLNVSAVAGAPIALDFNIAGNIVSYFLQHPTGSSGIIAGTAVGGSQDKKIRVLIGGTVYYIPLYTA